MYVPVRGTFRPVSEESRETHQRTDGCSDLPDDEGQDECHQGGEGFEAFEHGYTIP